MGARKGVTVRVTTSFGNEDFSARLPFQSTLLPPALRVAPAQPVEAFFEQAEDLRREVDALAKEE